MWRTVSDTNLRGQFISTEWRCCFFEVFIITRRWLIWMTFSAGWHHYCTKNKTQTESTLAPMISHSKQPKTFSYTFTEKLFSKLVLCNTTPTIKTSAKLLSKLLSIVLAQPFCNESQAAIMKMWFLGARTGINCHWTDWLIDWLIDWWYSFHPRSWWTKAGTGIN